MNDGRKEGRAFQPGPVLRETGKWLFSQWDKWECSECGHKVQLYDVRNFCPRCGAEMIEEEEEMEEWNDGF